MTMRISLLIFCLCAAPLSWGRDVYPPSVKKLPSIELGQAVLLLMPGKGSGSFDWDHLSEGPVVWLDDGYKAKEGGSPKETTWIRRGLMRIHVLGKKSTVLKKRKLELAWQVTYQTPGNPGLGVYSITLEPGTPDEDCFFSNSGGCTFDPIPSLKASGIRAKEICNAQSGGYLVTGFELSHAKRKRTYASVSSSGGSGGATTSITLWNDNGKELACLIE